eukprot:NODE_90_length_21577_cov_0.697691.p1 type:complete len:1099 gc:universal NODE_90_length_21577_cov_0.697691:15367-18663(+)
MKHSSDFLNVIENPTENQQKLQYYLNFYQNRKETLPLFADKINSANKAIILLFLNLDHGAINAQYLYENQFEEFFDFVISKHESVDFQDLESHFDVFVKHSSKIVTLESNNIAIGIAKTVINCGPILDERLQQMTRMYYIQCVEIITNPDSKNLLKLKDSCKIIKHSEYYDFGYVLKILFALTKQTKHYTTTCPLVCELILNILEKSTFIQHYNVLSLFCKSTLAKPISPSTRELVFKILYILFNYQVTLKQFQEFLLVFKDVDHSSIPFAYNAACLALDKIDEPPTSFHSLLEHEHYLARLLGLKISKKFNLDIFTHMLIASCDSHPIIKEEAEKFSSEFENWNLEKQLKCPTEISDSRFVEYLLELLFKIQFPARVPMLCAFVESCIYKNWYLSTLSLHQFVFENLISSPVHNNTAAEIFKNAILNSQKLNQEKKNYLTLALFVITQADIVQNYLNSLIFFKNIDPPILQKDVSLLFAICRQLVIRPTSKSLAVSESQLLQYIDNHDSLYVKYYIFIYLHQFKSFENLIKAKNEMKLHAIILNICKYYGKRLHSEMCFKNDEYIYKIDSSALTSYLELISGKSLSNLYFIRHSLEFNINLPMKHLFDIYIKNMDFLSSDYADIYFNAFSYFSKLLERDLCLEFVNMFGKIKSSNNVYYLFFKQIVSMTQYSNNVEHLFKFFNSEHEIYYFFTKHENDQVSKLMPKHVLQGNFLQHWIKFLYSFDGDVRLIGLLNAADVFKSVTMEEILQLDPSFCKGIPRLLDDPNPNCQKYAISTLQSFLNFDLSLENAVQFSDTLLLYGVANKQTNVRVVSISLLIKIIKKFNNHETLIPILLESLNHIEKFSGLEGDDLIHFIQKYTLRLIEVIKFQGDLNDVISLMIKTFRISDLPPNREFILQLLIKCQIDTNNLSFRELQDLVIALRDSDIGWINIILKSHFERSSKDMKKFCDFLIDTWAHSSSKVLDQFIVSFLYKNEFKTLHNLLNESNYDQNWNTFVKYIFKTANPEKIRLLESKLIGMPDFEISAFCNCQIEVFLFKYIEKYNLIIDANDILTYAKPTHFILQVASKYLLNDENYEKYAAYAVEEKMDNIKLNKL